MIDSSVAFSCLVSSDVINYRRETIRSLIGSRKHQTNCSTIRIAVSCISLQPSNCCVLLMDLRFSVALHECSNHCSSYIMQMLVYREIVTTMKDLMLTRNANVTLIVVLYLAPLFRIKTRYRNSLSDKIIDKINIKLF